ncbi:MAG: prolipoprotein diacylglyceryl transferase [Deltaproteobacteria bacterium]|nr:prolipoprotein diacylglyceryl transferase [Deltaproteobacteria bacterium]
MYPELITLGPLVIHSYGFFAVLGIVVATYLAVKTGKAHGVPGTRIVETGLVMAILGAAGARLAYVVMNVSFFFSHPVEIFKVWKGGLGFSGGILLVVPAMIFYLKHHHLPFWKMADLWSPSLAIGEAIGRIGCFMAGCCYGKPTDAIWGVVFSNPDSLAPLNVPLHPTQIYSFLAGLLIFGALIVLQGKKHYDGQVFLWYLILHSISRLYIERFRGDFRATIPGTDMTVTQLLALLILITAVTVLMFRKPGSRKEPDNNCP